MLSTRFFTALVVAACLATPVALADGLPELGDTSRNDLSPAMERRIGESLMNDIRLRDPAYLDDPEVEDYLNQIGQRIAAQSDEGSIGFRFFAVRDSTINAFAMFGGFIGVNTGLLLGAQTESELAGVLAHEISHVTQHHLARQIAHEKQLSVASIVSLALTILAARSNSQVAGAAAAATEAASIQSQLSYSRDFEREADRVGFDLLSRAQFDVQGMGTFFERLQKAGRVYENNAPVYLRTHPLSTERIADMANRAASVPYRQVPDSVEFQLVRAKLRASQGSPQDAVREFAGIVRERKLASEVVARYGYAYALQRDRQWVAAERELPAPGAGRVSSPMIDRLAAQLRAEQGDLAGARGLYAAALQRFPTAPALRYGYVEVLLALGEGETARRYLEDLVQIYTQDAKLQMLLARTYAALGRLGAQHRAQAAAYAIQGQLPLAIEQLQLAQKQLDNDFYEQSVIDARLRELKARQAEETKEAKRR